MPLADARALLPGLRVLDANPAADAMLLNSAAEACERFTPLVALDGPDGLVLDITGCAHLFGGEAGLHSRVRRLIRRAGIFCRASIASTPDAAHALARFTQITRAGPGEEDMLVRPLPVSALEQDGETTLALSRAGLKQLSDLIDRPSGPLVARFGADLLARLERIRGRVDLRITPLRAPPDMLAEQHFPEPLLDKPLIETVLAKLARDLCALLEARGEGLRTLEAGFFRADGAVRRIRIETGAACRDASTILRLLGLKLEAMADPLDPGFGFDAVRLGILRAEALVAQQVSLDGGIDAQEQVQALVDRLAARLGRERVQHFKRRDTHDPIRAGEFSRHSSRPGLWTAPEPENPPARPLTLFHPPQQIETLAEVPDGPPLRFRWRRILHEIARAEGPERIAPEWWRGGAEAPATRDYYRIEDAAGHRFWVFREGFYEDSTSRPQWFLHGLFA